MNPMANMVNVQVQNAGSQKVDQSVSTTQSTIKGDKGTVNKGAQDTVKDQPKEFDDVLSEAVETTEPDEKQPTTEQVPAEEQLLEGIAGLNALALNVMVQPETVLPQVNQGDLEEPMQDVLDTLKQQTKLPVQENDGKDLQGILEKLQDVKPTEQGILPKMPNQKMPNQKKADLPLQDMVQPNAQVVERPLKATELVVNIQGAVPAAGLGRAEKIQAQAEPVQVPETAKGVSQENAYSLVSQTEAKPQQQKNSAWQGKQERQEQPQLQNPNILSLRPTTQETTVKVFSPENSVQAEPQAVPSANPLAGLMQHVRMETVSAVQQPQAMPQPQATQHDIQAQIIDQAKLIKTAGDTQMVIKLKPEHLGELTLKVSVDHGVVSASFHTENAQVRAMLESSLTQLRQDLQNQGIKVDTVSVYAGLSDSLSQGQEGRQANQQSSRSKNRKVDLAEFEDRIEQVAPSMENSAEDGVDYRI